MTTEEIVSKYGNVKGSVKLQRLIEDYVLLLRTKVRTGEITAGTCDVSLPPVKLFCEMNDIILNWRKINKLLKKYRISVEHIVKWIRRLSCSLEDTQEYYQKLKEYRTKPEGMLHSLTNSGGEQRKK